jgi:DNA-binding CsgD family transcriptional regulator
MLNDELYPRFRDDVESGGRTDWLDPMTRPAAVSERLQIAEHALDWMRCAVFVLDSRSAIVFANRAAQRLLAAADGLHRHGASLVACVNGDAAALREAVARATEGRPARGRQTPPVTLRIRRGIDRLPLVATAVPVPGEHESGRATAPHMLLFVADPGAHHGVAPDLLQQAFGLTDREIGVALATLRLNGLPAAARELGIAPSTARSHLQHVFEKTCTRNQAALAQMLSVLGALRRADGAAGELS